MSQTYDADFLTVLATGSTVTTGASSASMTIPVDSAGNSPRYIRVAATTESYVKLGVSSATATTNDLLIQPADSAILAIPSGITKLAYIQGTSTGKLNVVPLENV